MNKYIIIKTVVFAFIMGFIFSCSKEDNYDWNSVTPGDQRISELEEDSAKLDFDTTSGNNYSINSYKAIARGGSKYDWISLGFPLSITQRDGQPFIIDVKADSRIDTFTWLKVSETTYGGKTGRPDSTKIYIIGFCAFSMDELLGNGSFTSTMSYYAPYNVNFTLMAGDTLINNNFFNMRWPVKYVLSKDYDQKVTIVPKQQFVYNDEIVEIKGSGHYNTCKGQMVVNYAVCHLYGDTLLYGWGVDSLLKK